MNIYLYYSGTLATDTIYNTLSIIPIDLSHKMIVNMGKCMTPAYSVKTYLFWDNTCYMGIFM